MKRIILTMLVAAIAAAMCVAAQSNANFQSKEGVIALFSKLNLSGVVNARLELGDKMGYRLSADPAYLQYYALEQSGSDLTFRAAPLRTSGDKTTPELVIMVNRADLLGKLEINLRGAARLLIDGLSITDMDVEAHGASYFETKQLKGRKAELEFKGAASAKISGADLVELEVQASGASNVTIEGKATKLEIDAYGAGRIETMNLSVDELEVDMSGAATAVIGTVNNTISELEASGAASITYGGQPTIGKLNVKGSARVNTL